MSYIHLPFVARLHILYHFPIVNSVSMDIYVGFGYDYGLWFWFMMCGSWLWFMPMIYGIWLEFMVYGL